MWRLVEICVESYIYILWRLVEIYVESYVPDNVEPVNVIEICVETYVHTPFLVSLIQTLYRYSCISFGFFMFRDVCHI